MDYFEVLGITSNATADEIKHAYARAVRKHPPEQDPEGFKQVREAFEHLSKGDFGRPSSLVLAELHPPKDALSDWLVKKVDEAYKHNNWRTLDELCSKGLLFYPDLDYFLDLSGIASIETNHPGKAVKTAKRLLELYPGVPAFRYLLFNAYDKRGWYKKALEVGGDLYVDGIRDIDFLVSYCDCLEMNEEDDSIYEICYNLLHGRTEFPAMDLESISYLWVRFLEVAPCGNASQVFDDFIAFLNKHRSKVATVSMTRTYLHSCMNILINVEIRDQTAFMRMVSALRPYAKSEDTREFWDDLMLEAEQTFSKIDPKMPDSFETFVMSQNEHEDLPDFLSRQQMKIFLEIREADCGLILLKEMDTYLELEEYMKQNYPVTYEFVRQNLDPLRDPANAERMRRKWEDLVIRMETDDVFSYFHYYPEEWDRIFGKTVHSTEVPIRREGVKVGRNDPCPCGSGKKFKRCCLGKGIYD